ncbi:cell cycle transcriptional regulator TrcR [Candidatus Odyssella acanthamoebae]|uniref:cell cycle transcriptional regulator TrcR n=1 Tax=Candidatus Odyssella acanthamoebae TaxID=91604 RepID=UPI00068A46DF|nr:cell cycle transcriptional regulator TrcR [Candidatus Paracaedibacter acanthamoebae]
MTAPLMPKATAIWLVENTALTFDQIADLCELHILEIQAIADGESGTNMIGLNPITSGQLSEEEIKRCEDNQEARLKLNPIVTADSVLGKKTRKYTPVSKRQDRPDAIAWLVKFHPELTDAVIARLLGTTKNMINSVRSKSHWNSQNIKPRSPVHLGLCRQVELDAAIAAASTDASKTDTPIFVAESHEEDNKF